MANLFFIILFQPFKFENHKLKYNMGAVLFKLFLETFAENRTGREPWEKLLEKGRFQAWSEFHKLYFETDWGQEKMCTENHFEICCYSFPPGVSRVQVIYQSLKQCAAGIQTIYSAMAFLKSLLIACVSTN